MTTYTTNRPAKMKRQTKKFATKKSTSAAKLETLRRKEIRKLKRGEL